MWAEILRTERIGKNQPLYVCVCVCVNLLYTHEGHKHMKMKWICCLTSSFTSSSLSQTTARLLLRNRRLNVSLPSLHSLADWGFVFRFTHKPLWKSALLLWQQILWTLLSIFGVNKKKKSQKCFFCIFWATMLQHFPRFSGEIWTDMDWPKISAEKRRKMCKRNSFVSSAVVEVESRDVGNVMPQRSLNETIQVNKGD